ncbi:MAG: hypothetical protein UX08_C0002G0050 [Candidatus Collierbacteria bacterium GW2011_GWB1_45_35]|uniref:Mutator family transposase n=2 Tax=Candidatus Collieribacteriota TaxID=1752725 RepID=A0A0G1KPJ5_9BACT|nr:MAG: hypothetical protein UW48_C0004G0061 [Microgenomates group bacterium GW2011_GWC1_44_23]KKT85448.1 MAG: hypothetical protein UW84_C0031G0006 [Candidatus Collierbacteria bacterium GW2011_GWA2_44_99]KKT95737.1 MAG: hypothetical protein UW96_C0005G0061 [Candidatus Collierbacteria bacterium GW2011_GWA1_45_15]KKU00384.1 MAG: hypothetical protein UX01_C0005G0061 [Candidatus Collierbacteria bacterium GW2011_GWB2_45_17]KKU05835.1 MAG: hypothetical protein UX08_C0002G0050 [Candidatus Collierbacte
MGTVFRRVNEVLSKLPHCADITRNFASKYTGILLVDGKYVKVKGYDRKLPVVYGVDYQSHDIPSYRLGVNEGYLTLLKFFSSLKLANYPLQAMVCDDNQVIRDACLNIFPRAVVQLCQNHYKQNVRNCFDLKTDFLHLEFVHLIEDLLSRKRSLEDHNQRARYLFDKWKYDPICLAILTDLAKSSDLLLGWRNFKGLPITTNLIECFNSHLQGRLKTIKGFESMSHADTWLNGYFLRRRTKKLTDCEGKFKPLNGKIPLQISKKPGIDIPIFF